MNRSVSVSQCVTIPSLFPRLFLLPPPTSHTLTSPPPPTLPRQNVSTFGTLIDGKTWLLLDVMEKFHIIMAQGHQHSLC